MWTVLPKNSIDSHLTKRAFRAFILNYEIANFKAEGWKNTGCASGMLRMHTAYLRRVARAYTA